jgi:hypothetical protein
MSDPKYASGTSTGKPFTVHTVITPPKRYLSGTSLGKPFTVLTTVIPPVKYLAGTSQGTTLQVIPQIIPKIRYTSGTSMGTTFQVVPLIIPKIRYISGKSRGTQFQVTLPVTLIELAIYYTKQAYNEIIQKQGVINTPLTPKAVYSYRYLVLREMINTGCSEAVKHILNPYKRSIAYSILKKAVQRIFYYGKNPKIIEHYNNLLQQTIGQT